MTPANDYLDTVGVTGSIPVAPTTFCLEKPRFYGLEPKALSGQNRRNKARFRATNWAPVGQSKRLHALDGLRGVLALAVVADHAAIMCLHTTALDPLAQIAVVGFFIMSALVLARAYDGRYVAFLRRRFARLFPVYAVCVAAGMAALGHLDTPAMADGPTWSLNVEALAMLGFPLIVWAGATERRFLSFMMGLAALMLIWHHAVYAVPFLIGSRFRDYAPVVGRMNGPAPQWLGKVSYSLYLSHVPVIMAFGACGLPLILPVAWCVWWAVERPSIAWSRAVGR